MKLSYLQNLDNCDVCMRIGRKNKTRVVEYEKKT